MKTSLHQEQDFKDWCPTCGSALTPSKIEHNKYVCKKCNQTYTKHIRPTNKATILEP